MLDPMVNLAKRHGLEQIIEQLDEMTPASQKNEPFYDKVKNGRNFLQHALQLLENERQQQNAGN
jgi:hypothetical protein